MLSNSSKKQNVESYSSSVKSQVRLVNGPKPLTRFKFYLDIKNHLVCSKVEEKIKELGGSIELFFVRDVTHVVSDKCNKVGGLDRSVATPQSTTPKTPLSSTVHSNESGNSNVGSPFTPTDHTQRKKPKSRADAMLERVRLQTTPTSSINVNPLENAKLWGIPIWSVEKVFGWLEKVTRSILKPADDLSSLKKKSKLQETVQINELKPPFIKFEPLTRDARPVYKELPIWPTINLNASKGGSPFVVTADSRQISSNVVESKTNNKEAMIRKTRISLRSLKVDEPTAPVQQSGYCEICRCDYQDLTKHVRSENHLNFIRDDSNFLSLDSLITAGANVEAFLRLNGSSKKDDSTDSCTMFSTRRSSRRNNLKTQIDIKINGDVGLSKKSQLTPNIDKSLNMNPVIPRITRSSSACEKTNPADMSPAPISPALSDTTHHLRSRGQLWLPSNLLGTTAEDEGNPVKPNKSESRSNSLLKLVKDESNTDESDDEQPLSKHLKKLKQEEISPCTPQKKKNSTKPKRPTADDRLLSENRAYYKVEVLSSKLRSNASYRGDSQHNTRQQSSIINSEDSNSKCDKRNQSPNDRLVVKFRRVRRSELSTLSNEAENFMFPRRGDDSSTTDDDHDCDTDEDRNTTLNSPIMGDSSDIKSSDPDFVKSEERKANSVTLTDECSQDCSVLSSCESDVNVNSSESKRKKRRRTHAEVFIQDNEKYYKFETPGSRLRFQGSFLPLMTGHQNLPLSNNNDSTVDIKDNKTEIKTEEEHARSRVDIDLSHFKTLPSMEKLTYSFQRVADDNIDRLDENQSFHVQRDFELFVNMYCSKFVPLPLPYEMNKSITPRDPQLCKQIFLKRLKSLEESNNGVDGNSETNHSEVNSLIDGGSEVFNEDQLSNGSSRQSIDKNPDQRRRRRRRVFSIPGKNPRKSPRQHASTLAILSGLLHQRRRKTKSGSGMESENECISLTPINEQNESSISACPSPAQSNAEPSVKVNCDLENLELTEEDIAAIDSIVVDKDYSIPEKDFHENTLLNVLNTYHESNVLEIGMKEKWNKDIPAMKCGMFQGNYSLFTPKEFKRKNRRKKNRTGWPNSKRRVLSRRNFTTGNETSILEECYDSEGTVGEMVGDLYTIHDQKRRSRKRKNEFSDCVTDLNVTTHDNKENTSQVTAGPSKVVENSSPSRNSSRNPSMDVCLGFSAEECAEVNKWSESVDNILNEKLTVTLRDSSRRVRSSRSSSRPSIDFQPYVKVQKIEAIKSLHHLKKSNSNRQLRSSSSPHRAIQPTVKRRKIEERSLSPAASEDHTVEEATVTPPPSPRKLRKPRGQWYRDR